MREVHTLPRSGLAGETLFHNHPGTSFDRYPAMFRAVRARVENTRGQELGGRALRILSFGCSTGAEMRTIRQFFPDAEVLGCDIDMSRPEADLPGEVFFSTPEAIVTKGPYDLIFANSVLCARGRFRRDFPFNVFEKLTTPLHLALKDLGLLCIYNSTYRFRDLSFAEQYRPVRSDQLFENGFLPKFTSDGTRLSEREKNGGINRQRILRPDIADEWDFRDCIFEKAPGEPVRVDLSGIHIPVPAHRMAPAYVPKWHQWTAGLFSRKK